MRIKAQTRRASLIARYLIIMRTRNTFLVKNHVIRVGARRSTTMLLSSSSSSSSRLRVESRRTGMTRKPERDSRDACETQFP